MTTPSWHNEPSGTMRAAVLTSPGVSPPSACFTIDYAYPKPTLPSPDWVLVRVYAAGLNRAELRSRNGDPGHPLEFNLYKDEYHEDPPAILGEEMGGVIEVAGANTSFTPGDKVAAWMFGGGKAHNGSYAEYAVSRKECVVKIKTSLPWEVVGGAATSMWTAYGALILSANMKENSTVFIHGATGSVGVWGILLAKDKGCTVIATTRQTSKIDALKRAGADHVLLEEDLPNSIGALVPAGIKVWFELIGTEFNEPYAFPLMAKYGTVVDLGMLTKNLMMDAWSLVALGSTRRLTMYTTEAEDMEIAGKVLQEIIDKIEKGVIKRDAYMSNVYPLESIGEAHLFMEENKAVGKVVITI
jgi:NADPH:quinone reductase-like Zn-dependent oxidoreductase